MRVGLSPLLLIVSMACSDDRPRDQAPPVVIAVGAIVPALYSRTALGDSVHLTFPSTGPSIMQIGAFGCGLCREQWPLLDSLKRVFGAAGVRVIVVTMDEAPADHRIRTWVASDSSKFEVWRDADRTVANTIGVEGLPQIVVIGNDGRLLRRQIGVPKGITPEWVKVLDSVVTGH